MTIATETSLILANLSTERFWTAGSIAARTGLDRDRVQALLEEFDADGLVKSRVHDAFRLTYALVA